MCGIVGYVGARQAAPILLRGLPKLEYRGYDSAGLATRDGDSPAEVVKAVGKLKNLAMATDDGTALVGSCGIGHTRWATHGGPSKRNAHPHVSGKCSGTGSGAVESKVVGVHNGVIENHAEIREKLSKAGYSFYSDTDTEALVKLVDYYWNKYGLGPVDALARTLVRVRGSYALEVMFRDAPGVVWAAKKDSPMAIGVADGETFVASDARALLGATDRVHYVDDLEMADIGPGTARFFWNAAKGEFLLASEREVDEETEVSWWRYDFGSHEWKAADDLCGDVLPDGFSGYEFDPHVDAAPLRGNRNPDAPERRGTAEDAYDLTLEDVRTRNSRDYVDAMGAGTAIPNAYYLDGGALLYHMDAFDPDAVYRGDWDGYETGCLWFLHDGEDGWILLGEDDRETIGDDLWYGAEDRFVAVNGTDGPEGWEDGDFERAFGVDGFDASEFEMEEHEVVG